MPNKQAEITALDKVFIGRIDNVGDMTYYNVAIAHRYADQTIYVALGGNYSPKIGGFFPKGTLMEFELAVKLWAYNIEGGHDFMDYVKGESYYKYMLGRQLGSDIPHAWDFTVAFVVAWLYGLGKFDSDCLRIIGALHTNNKENTRLFLEERVQIWGSEEPLATEARDLWVPLEYRS